MAGRKIESHSAACRPPDHRCRPDSEALQGVGYVVGDSIQRRNRAVGRWRGLAVAGPVDRQQPDTGLGRRVGMGVENTRAGRRVGDRGDGPNPPRGGAAIGEHQPVARLARRGP
jgi:hypothetical protein